MDTIKIVIHKYDWKFSPRNDDQLKTNPSCSSNCLKKQKLEIQKFRGRIFVGNIPSFVTSKQLWTFFETQGSVVDAFVLKRNGISTRCGFVTFSDSSKLCNLENRAFLMSGKELRISSPVSRYFIRHRARCPNKWKPWSTRRVTSSTFSNSSESSSGNFSHRHKYSCNSPKSYSTASLSNLDNNSLLHIFSYIPTYDYQILERVSLRWKYLIKKICASFSKLTLSSFRVQSSLQLFKDIKFLLSRMNPEHLTSLDLSAVGEKLPLSTWSILSSLAPNLVEANFSYMRINDKASYLYSSSSRQKLQKLILESVEGLSEKALWWLLKASPLLSYLHLSNCPKITGTSSLGLKTLSTLKTLILQNIPKLRSGPLSRLLLKSSSLEHFIVYCIDISDFSVLLSAMSSLRSLKNLTLVNLFPISNPSSINSWTSSFWLHKTLVEINVSYSYAPNRNFVLLVSLSCPFLKALDLSRCFGDPSIDDSCIRSLLSSSQNLRVLKLNYPRAITNTLFSHLGSHLRVLELCGAPIYNINNESLFYLSQTKEISLEFLDLSGCNGLSTSVEKSLRVLDDKLTHSLTLRVGKLFESTKVPPPIFRHIVLNFEDYVFDPLRYNYHENEDERRNDNNNNI